VTKSTGLKYVKPGMSSYFSVSRDPSYVSSAMYPECPKKEWRTKPFGLQSTPSVKRPRWRDGISHLALSRLGVETAEQSEIAVDREVFRALLGLLSPRLSLKEKLHSCSVIISAQDHVNVVCCITSSLPHVTSGV